MKSCNAKRRRRRQRQWEQHKNQYLYLAAHFFSYFFLDVGLHGYDVNSLVTHLMEEMLYMYVHTNSFVACVPVGFFSLLLIFTFLAISISHFLTANFHVFLPTKFASFVFFIQRCSSFSVIHVSKDVFI